MRNTKNNTCPASLRRALPALLALSALTLTTAAHAQYTIRAIGDNSYGQAGNGTMDAGTFAAATQPVGAPAYTAISSGGRHSLAIGYDGTLYAWGDNSRGQVGDGTYVDKDTPTATFIHDAVACAAGGQHSLVLRSDGQVYAWGDNTVGELGVGAVYGALNAPTRVNLTNVASIAAGGYTSAAITYNGDLYMWGESGYAQVGNGSLGNVYTPALVMHNVVQVACGSFQTIAIKTDGTVWAWGNNAHGQLGTGAKGGQAVVPQQVPGLNQVYRVASGATHMMAIKNGGTVVSWGDNTYGQLGLGDTTDRYAPTPVPLLSGVAQITAGSISSAARLDNGEIYGWGDNALGQLGTSYFTRSTQPTFCFACGGAFVISIAMGSNQMLALIDDMTVVTGTITPEGNAPNAKPQTMELEVRPDTPGRSAYSRRVFTQPDGTFAAFPIQRDTGVLHIKGPKNLAVNAAYDARQTYVSVAVTLPAGDCNNDNSVDATDFNIFVTAYNTDASVFGGGYDARADFNGDGFVDPTDFGLLVGSYNATGDL